MAEITREDLISDDALRAPGILTEEFQKLLDKLDGVVRKSQEYVSAVSGVDGNTLKLKESTAGLSEEQRVLAQIQTQIATLTAKQSDAYQEQISVLNNLKQSVKDKTALGEQEAQSVTRENSSRNQLLAALNSNRAAYSNLRNEQERNSPIGKELLKTIQEQDKQYKELSSTIGQNQAKVGSYRSELEGLIEHNRLVQRTLGESGAGVKEFGQALLQIITSPIGLTILGIATAVGITKAALDVFYEDSIQGQDELNGKFNFFKASLEVLKDTLFGLGKSASGWLDTLGTGFKELVLQMFPQLSALFSVIEIKQEKLNQVTELQNEIRKEEIRLTVEVSKLELEKQTELYTARDKANQQLEIRYEALQKAKVLLKEEIDLRLIGINNEILLQQKAISVNTAKSVVDLTSNQILAQANDLGRVNYEQIEKLAQLEIKRNQILGEQFQGQRRVQALEASIVDEAIKKQVEYEKAILNSRDKSYEEGIKKDRAFWDRILQNSHTSYDGKLEALAQNVANEAVLNDFAKFQAIRTEREKFEAVTTLSKEEHDRINVEAKGDLEKRAELERLAKTMLVQDNTQFLQVQENIEKEFKNREIAITEKAAAEELRITKEYNLKKLEAEKRIGEQFIITSISITNGLFDAASERIQHYLTDLDEWYKQELTLAGNSADAKTKIEKEYTIRQKELQEEQAQIKRKQAIFDKAAAVVEIAFKTGVAIAEAIAASPLTFGQPWAGVIAVIGALQEAAVLAKPIPQYYLGTDWHSGGSAIVGELGSELIGLPSGQQLLSPNSATLMNLPRGAEVFTHSETLKMMTMAGLRDDFNSSTTKLNYDSQILGQLKQSNRFLKENRVQHIEFVRSGVALVEVVQENKSLIKRIRHNVMIGG